jgi:hypothetical protein
MERLFLFLIIFVISIIVTSQKRIVEAIYLDTIGTPYKIERKYSYNQSVTYVLHGNQNSVCVVLDTIINKDTTIIQESYYSIYRETTKFDTFLNCDSWLELSTSNGDTVTLSGFSWGEYVGDTILVGEAAEKSWNFHNRIKSGRVPLILANEINVNLDSLIENASFRVHYFNGLPFKIERFDAKQNLHALTTFEFSENMMLSKSFFYKDSLDLFETDTIIWNSDTTEVEWNYHRYDWNKNYKTKYLIDRNKLIIIDDSVSNEIIFMNNRNIFKNLMKDIMLYTDVYYYFDLQHFDRLKIDNKTIKGQTTTYNYIFNEEGDILEQKIFQNEDLQRSIIYNYKRD